MRETGLANHELTGKDSTFFYRDGFRRHVAVQRAGLVNSHRTGRDDFRRHSSFDVHASDRHATKALNIGFSLNDHMFGGEAAGNFSGKVNRNRFVALKVPPQFPFDQGRLANHARAA